MHIEKGELKPANADGKLADALPQHCGDASPSKAEAGDDQVIDIFKATYSASCDTLAPDAAPDAAKPEINVIRYRLEYETEKDAEHEARLFKFPCGSGAYNAWQVYYLATEFGITPLQFAEPWLDIRFDDPDQQRKVESMTIVGYKVSDQLVNSEFDPQESAVTSANLWRGIGDVSSSGKWVFRNGGFILVRYEVDATKDDEINAETVIDFESAP